MKIVPKSLINDRYKYLFGLVMEHWVRFCLALGCMIIVAGTASAKAFLVKPALDDIFLKKDIQMKKN